MKKLLLTVSCMMFGAMSPVMADDFKFAQSQSVDGTTLQRVAQAEFGYLLLDISKSALYVDTSVQAPIGIMTPGYAKAIEIEYLLDVSKEKFTELTLEALNENWPKETLARYKTQIAAFCKLYEDVKEGERYMLKWKQGYGLELLKNGRSVGKETDSNAAYVILSIWLGRAAADQDHLNDLLAQWRSAKR